MKFKPLYCEDRLRKKIINPEGDTGIVTLWTKSKIIEEDLANKLPDLFKKKFFFGGHNQSLWEWTSRNAS